MSQDGGTALSLRDPHGQLLALGERLFRIIHRSSSDFYRQTLERPKVQSLKERGILVPWSSTEFSSLPESLWTEARIDRSETGLVLEHPPVWFASYPSEWPAQMLHSAGTLTLSLFRELRTEGMGLKDASPYNVLFEGSKPLFCDLLSIEKRPEKLATWTGVGQFLRCFVHPLIAHRYLNTNPHEIYWLHRDGIETDSLYPNLGLRKFHPSLFFSVTLPTVLHRRMQRKTSPAASPKLYQGLTVDSQEKADFILNHVLDRLEQRLQTLAPKRKSPSIWMRYMDSEYSFTDKQLLEKEKIVDRWSKGMNSVLDVGCNTGHFSRIAEKNRARVVAIDYDPQVVGRLWEDANDAKLDIQPLVVNFARPTPSLGWRNGESRSFLDRAEKKFEGAMFLATLHHLTITEGIPLPEVLRLASRLVTKSCLMEFISPQDRAFRDLCRGRDFSHLTQDYFETEAAKLFHIESKRLLPDSERTLYVLTSRC